MEQVSNAQQSQGANARELCIHIAKEMSDLVKHTLGPMGLDNMGGSSANRVTNTVADSLGRGAGEEMHQLSSDELPARNSYISHGSGGQGDSHGSFSYVHHLNTDTIGDDQPHNNMPPYLSINFIIKY